MESNRPTKFPTNPRLQVQIILAAVTFLTAIGFIFFPWVSDDLSYRMPFREYFLEGGSVTINDMWSAFIMRLHTDNGRLATPAMIIVQMAPRWTHVLESGMAVWLMLWYGLKTMGLRSSVPAACIWSFVITMLLPWMEQLYVFDFQVAYLWGAAFAIVLTYMLLAGKGNYAGIIFMALIVGVWQEAYGLPMLVGTACLWLFYPQYRTQRTIIVAIILLIGLIWLYFAPGGLSYRSSYTKPILFRFQITLPYLLPSLIAAGIVIYRLLRKLDVSPTLLFLSVSAVTSGIVMMYAMYGIRVGMWSAMAGWAAVLMQIHLPRLPRSLKLTICGAALAVVVLHLTCVDMICYEQDRDYEKMVAQFRTDGGSYIYTNVHLRTKAPLLCLQKPYFGTFTLRRNLELISEFYRSDGKTIKVVPEEFKGLVLQKTQPISSKGFYTYQGFIIGPDGDSDMEFCKVNTTYKSGTMTCRDYLRLRFIDANGIARGWYLPLHIGIRDYLEPIPQSMELN